MAEFNWNQLNGSELLKALEQYCTDSGVSDIHFSPEKNAVRTEIRLHGSLELLAKVTPSVYEELVRRVKFLSKLKLNVTNIPQDGQYVFKAPERVVNVRVASIPSRFGETFTLRLLDPKKGMVPLEQLGFTEDMHNRLKEVVKCPNGLFLVTGPTGSGKTTTLYALLRSLVGTKRNIITLEDPIEYELEGIVQSQIANDKNYTFASGLRSILRHDPDVILLGEIRDFETAQTAIDAALTGHMVLATLHTNTAIEAIPRLLSMGVTPYTFGPALRAVLAQRLVRTLKEEYKQTPESELDTSGSDIYGGRTTIAELLMIDTEIQELILLNESASTIEKQARDSGYTTMKEAGKLLVEQNLTTQIEIHRVTT